MKKLLQLFAFAVITMSGITPAMGHENHAGAHPIGTNVISNGTVYFISPDGTLRPYTSAGAFLSYGFNSWASVQQASSADLALPRGSFLPPQDGKIICDNKVRIGTCYLITEGQKIGFVTEADFKNLGFSFSRALWGDVWFLPELQNIASGYEAHRTGVLINDKGTIYYVTPIGRAGFPTYDIFLSWGFSLADVVQANAADMARPQIDTVYYRQLGELRPTVGQRSNTVRLIAPNGNENWTLGTTKTIIWDNTLFDSEVNIYLNEYYYCDYPNPCLARAERSYQLAHKIQNTGEFSWNVGTSISQGVVQSGLYKVSITGANNTYVFDESDNPFTVILKETEGQIRDQKRLSDVRQMAAALELYFNDNNAYPSYLSDLSPSYIQTLPAAPNPDGSCSAYQNLYTYTRQSALHYTLSFCFGASTGGYSAGVHTLSEAGIQ